jgi:phosphatidylglycerophosphate synthase
MLDRSMRKLLAPALERIGKFIAEAHISANVMTIIGFTFGLMCFGALVLRLYPVALILLFLNRAFDGLDGPVARATVKGPSDLGAYLDIVTDFIFYAGFVFFFALGHPEDALIAAFLIFSFMGTASSFLAYAIIAEKRQIKDEDKSRGFYFLNGLTEGTETFIFFFLICIMPQNFGLLAMIFATMCWITTISRVYKAYKDWGAERDGLDNSAIK